MGLADHVSAGEMLELLKQRRGQGATADELAAWAGVSMSRTKSILAGWLSDGRIRATAATGKPVWVLVGEERNEGAPPTDAMPLASWVPAGVVQGRTDRQAERDAFGGGYQAALNDLRAWLAKAGG